MITILESSGNSNQMLITYQIQNHSIKPHHDQSYGQSVALFICDYCNNQAFAPNFRRLATPLTTEKDTYRVPDVECMTIYPYRHWPPNFSPQA